MKRIVLAAGLLVVVAVIAAGTFWLLRPGPASKGKSAARPRHRLASGPIAHSQVLLAAYGKEGKGGRLALPDGRTASVWAEQPFRIGDVERMAVLIALEREGDECHACPAALGAAVYRKEGERWTLESKSYEIGRVGSFGEAGSPEGLEVRPIGPNKIVLLVPSSHMSQGITGSGDRLFLYAPPKWIDAGYVELAGDNSGTCSDDPKERQAEHLDPCWKMTGTLNPVPASGKEFYDIRVTRSGKVEDKPAQNSTLVFDGKTYVEKTP